MAAAIGIYILVELVGVVADRVREIQERFDPKLSRLTPPHITLVGSSGLGAIPSDTPTADLRAALAPVCASTPPMTLRFGAPMRFMQTDIISLPLDPHGPLRTLHEQIGSCGLSFKPSRFLFTPHCTLNFFRTLTRDTERALLAQRVPEPFLVDRIQVHLTRDPQPSRLLLELPLEG